MSNWFGNIIDAVGTGLNLPEMGASEWFSGGNATTNTNILNAPIQGMNGSGGANAWAKAAITKSQQDMANPGGAWSMLAPSGSTPGNSTPVPDWYTNGSGAGGSGSGGSAFRPDAAQLAQYDQAIKTTQSGLDRLGNQLNIAYGNIDSKYNTNRAEQDTNKTQAQSNYNQSTTQNRQGYRTNQNTIQDQASGGLNGLLRMLGAYGAGGRCTN